MKILKNFLTKPLFNFLQNQELHSELQIWTHLDNLDKIFKYKIYYDQ